MFGGAVPLTGPGGKVDGYYDHQAAKAGLGITAQYAAIAPLFQPGGWMEVFPATGGTAVTRAISDGIDEAIHMHHAWTRFLGGPAKQDREALRESLHIGFHSNLRQALKNAEGFPNVGGRGGGTTDWQAYFEKYPERYQQAIDILRQVSRDFDRVHGTGITKRLENELSKGVEPYRQ
jgi:hypothetical protein